MVYSKVWTDHSSNNALGLRLTMEVQDGNILQAGLVTLVTAAGAAFWSITAYVIFRLLLRNQRTNGLGASIRLLLANSRGRAMDSWTFFRLGLRWHGHTKGALWRCFSIMIFALLIWAGWIVASLFVSRAALYGRGNDITPIVPTACGLRRYDNSTQGISARATLIEEDTATAQIWVKDCYTTSPDPLRCTGPPVIALEYNSSTASCPWPGNRCLLGPDAAWRMRTSIIDSHRDLGVNAIEADRVGVIIDTTCSVINYTDVLTRVVDPSTNGNFSFLRLNFGSIPGLTNYTWQYSTHTANDGVSYQITPVYIPAQDSLVQVIPAMKRSDGDLVLAFFAANDVVYTTANEDPLYLASGAYTINGYVAPDNYVRVVACHQQYQLHNPVTKLNSSLNSITQLQPGSLGFNEQQQATAIRIYNSLLPSDIYNSIAGFGGRSLLANSLVYGSISPGLPDNQWISEVQYWFEIGLTKFARYMVDFPSNSQAVNKDFITIQDPSFIPGLTQQCETQLASTQGLYQTFSFIAIIIIIVISVTIIVLSWTLASCVAKVGGPGRAAEEGYQLLSLLVQHLQERGYGGFLRTDTTIPVRSGNEEDIPNPSLDDGRLNFPRYHEPGEEIDHEREAGDEEANVEEVEMHNLVAK